MDKRMDNTTLIICLEMLLQELQSKTAVQRKTAPVNLVVKSSRYKQIKLDQGGTEYKPYGQACNEKHFYKGRPVIVRRGTSRRRCLFGVMTSFRKVPYAKVKDKMGNGGSMAKEYKADTPIAAIDFLLTDLIEYNLERGVPVALPSVETPPGS